MAGLTKSYLERAKFDSSLKKYIAETEDFKISLSQTKISLNEVTRKLEMAEAEKKKTRTEKLDTKVISKEGLPTDELLKLNDEYLREGLLILADLLTKRIG